MRNDAPYIYAFAIAAAAAGSLAAAPANAQATDESGVDIMAYDVEGNTLLDQEAVEAAVYPYLGPKRARDDVDAARASLEKAYHDKGYQSVVVDIPPQTVKDGLVRLHVVEASIGRVRVTGAKWFSPSEIRREAPSLKEGSTPDFRQTQREFADLNRLGDRQVTPLLRPGKAPGTVDVELKVKDNLPLHASLEVNNDHARDTPDLRASATVRYDNLWQKGHSVSLTYSAAPEDRRTSEVYAGSYLAPIWGSPWSVLLFGYNSNSDVATLGGANVLGKGYAVGLRGIRQLSSLGGFSQSLSLGGDFKHFDQNIKIGPAAVAATIDYWPLTGSYTAQRASDAFMAKATLGATVGLGIGGDTGKFQDNRAYAHPDFVHVNLDLELSKTLPYHFEAAARLSAQLADTPLLSSEQFALGGLTSVRGYLQSEAVGDYGAQGSVELRSMQLTRRLEPVVGDWRFYAFVDGGYAKLLRPLVDQEADFSLYSVGLGTRFSLFDRIRGDLGVGVPLKASGATDANSASALISLKSEF